MMTPQMFKAHADGERFFEEEYAQKKRTVVVDIDEFLQKLEQQIGEDGDWTLDDLLCEVDSPRSKPIHILHTESVAKIVGVSAEILENLYADQEQTLENASVVDTFPLPVKNTAVSK